MRVIVRGTRATVWEVFKGVLVKSGGELLEDVNSVFDNVVDCGEDVGLAGKDEDN